MADSTTSLVIAGVSAVAAVGSAVVAVLQAKSAKRQAKESASQAYHAATSAAAAKEQAEAAKKQVAVGEKQVDLMAAQVRAAEQQNRLAERVLDRDEFRVDVRPQFVRHHGNVAAMVGSTSSVWVLEVVVENNSKQTANIRRVALQVATGLDIEWVDGIGTLNGQGVPSSDEEGLRLPLKLEPGESCTFLMFEYQSTLDVFEFQTLRPINWSDSRYRPVKGILVRANNRDFVVTEGEWRRRIETDYLALSPPKGTV